MIDFNNIKLVVSDLDGTLTNGMYHVSDDGRIAKSFNTRDFYGLQILRENGIKTLILTHCYDRVIEKKIEQMPSNDLYLEIVDWSIDKTAALSDWVNRHVVLFGLDGLVYDQIAFIGDSENDADVMSRCGLTGCPSDAVSMIKDQSNFVSHCPGGGGAVYDFAKYILTRRGNNG